MRRRIGEAIRAGVKHSSGLENRAQIDDCMAKISRYRQKALLADDDDDDDVPL